MMSNGDVHIGPRTQIFIDKDGNTIPNPKTPFPTEEDIWQKECDAENNKKI